MPCWAKTLGDCSRTISGEHVISAAIFEQDELNVTRRRWPRSTAKLPKKRLVAKILCKTHNERLSPLDAEAGRLSAAVRQLYREPSHFTLSVDGHAYERWCVKTLLGLIASRWVSPVMPEIPLEFTEMAFGLRSLPVGAGLYVSTKATGQGTDADACRYGVLFDSQTQSHAWALFIDIHGFASVVTVGSGNAAKTLEQLGRTSVFDFTDVRMRYRPHRMQYQIAKTGALLKLQFRW